MADGIAVDALCVGCELIRVHVQTDHREDAGLGKTFLARCRSCNEEQPHNIRAYLTGLNHPRTGPLAERA